jgi:hypothetical protein
MANTSYSYPYVEDYIEIIAGYRSADGKITKTIFQLPQPVISLARYDVRVIESFAQQAHDGIGFTDRQAKLATDLVIKYERQLSKWGVGIDTVKTNPVFRVPLRTIDRTSRVWLEQDQIRLRFPFNTELVDIIRKESKQSLGNIHFDRDLKLWIGDLTEYNLSWVYAFAQANNFEIDPAFQNLMNLVLELEQTNYQIELKASDRLSISNAADSLNSYIQDQLGGFDLNNILALVDASSTLGYSVNSVIEETIIEAYGPRFYSLCTNRELKVDANLGLTEAVKEIVDYARTTDRFPIYLHEPDQSDRMAMLFIRHFAKPQIATQVDAVTDETQLVISRLIPKTPVERIPLMVSTAGMMYGGDRQLWLQTAEKIVYFSADVYNKNKNSTKVKKL